jgi:hypothetical protein
MADLNIYAYSFMRILAPHTRGGAAVREETFFDRNPQAFEHTPREVGGQGGNVGLLDGSVQWKGMSKMLLYRTSQLWEESGSFGLW